LIKSIYLLYIEVWPGTLEILILTKTNSYDST
jgi:hypothetical protein